MKFLILILLAVIAWLISRLIYTVNSYREDLGDIKRQIGDLNAKLSTHEKTPQPTGQGALRPPESVNINTANKTRLQTLPKVGAVTAQRIIEARPFTALEELMQVEGITPELFAQLKTRIVL